MKSTRILIVILCSMAGASVFAGEDIVRMSSPARPAIVIELFTSQGCSSCPPAERWLNALKDDKRLWADLIPVAFHVDYWDQLGWPDLYARPEYSMRQYQYRAQGSVRSVYTPAVLVNGEEWRGWYLGQSLKPEESAVGRLEATVTPQLIEAQYSDSKDLILTVVVLGFGIETKIERGENRYRTLEHEFVALKQVVFPAQNGSWQVQLPQVRDHTANRYALALWVSKPDNPGPVQAAGGWVPDEWVMEN